MDIIGIMYQPATVDAEGNEVTPAIALPGWHVNTPEPVEGWEDKQVTPATPMRVYGGHATYFYSFASEDEFTAMAIEAGLLPAPETVEEIE